VKEEINGILDAMKEGLGCSAFVIAGKAKNGSFFVYPSSPDIVEQMGLIEAARTKVRSDLIANIVAANDVTAEERK